MADTPSSTLQIARPRRARGFSLSLSINSPRRLSLVSSNNTLSPVSQVPPTTPGRFKRALKRIGSFRIFHPRGSPSSSSASYQWNGAGMLDTDYMYDDDMDVSYEGLLSLAARIGDAKPRNLPSELKETLPRGVYKDCPPAQVESHCAICLEKYDQEHKVMGVSECSHYFHAHCFETWLDLASNCPVCRRELTPEDYKRSDAPQQSSSSSSSSPTSPLFMDYYRPVNGHVITEMGETPDLVVESGTPLRVVTLDEMRSNPDFRRLILPPPPVPEDY